MLTWRGRYLQQWVGVLQEPAHDGVSGLVIGYSLLLCGLQDLGLLLQTWKDHRRVTLLLLLGSSRNTSSSKHPPPITRSMACSKCLALTDGFRCLAAISAASLQTLAMSAPDWFTEVKSHTGGGASEHPEVKVKLTAYR